MTDDPIARFHVWFEEAVAANHPMPEAMTLATVDDRGQPDARMVLLKALDADGFVFYTNYQSPKAEQLMQGHAALVFWWENTRRQVRVRGPVRKVDAAESDAYFATRPRLSQLGAWTSPQSEPISDRAFLEARFAEVDARYADKGVPRPSHWGGYVLAPTMIEFWTERPHRLHDREVFRRELGGPWQMVRLAP